MNETKRSDLNLSVVGTGFATSVGAGCALLVVLSTLVVSVGVHAGRRGHLIAVLALILGIAVHCVVGNVTGRTARAKRAPVNFHVVFVGGLVMLFALLLLLAPGLGTRGRQPGELAMVIRAINILLTIPAMWLGANWGPQGLPEGEAPAEGEEGGEEGGEDGEGEEPLPQAEAQTIEDK